VAAHLKACLELLMSRNPLLSVRMLDQAMRERRWALVRALVRCGIEHELSPPGEQWHPLVYAVCYRMEDVVSELLAAGARPSGEGGQIRGSNDALRIATLTRQPSMITLLLAAGADTERRDARARTALHDAAHFDADVDALCEQGRPPIFEAIDTGANEALEALVRHGADLAQVYGVWGSVRTYAHNSKGKGSWIPAPDALQAASPPIAGL